MIKSIKVSILILITAMMIFANMPKVFASFADFTDEEADKQAQEQIKEQEKEHNVTEVKSSDNYLIELQVENYELTPEFDKQTLEYTIKGELKSNQINIKAKPSNEKSTINGIGTIKIEDDKNEYRVDVTAENGSVRTYIIKLKETLNNKSTQNDFEAEQDKEINQLNDINNENQNIDESKNDEIIFSNIILYVIIAIICIVIIFASIRFLKGKKSKH